MTNHGSEPRAPRIPWTWTFYSAAELHVALEEYTAFEPGVGVPDGGGVETVEVDRGEVYAWRCWCEPQTTRDLEVLMRQVPRRRDD